LQPVTVSSVRNTLLVLHQRNRFELSNPSIKETVILKKKMLLSGNEAIARGAFEAGATVGTGYPGTPSTEILESFTGYPGVYTEWSVNEKVAFEVAIGASLAGARTLVTMKHVGLNVAADPLFTASYIGVSGGLVIVNADDPDMHSSQNEQDNRNYAFAAKVPMFEPSDCAEAKELTIAAFEASERYDTPVMVRTVTRLSHSLGVVEAGPDAPPARKIAGFVRNVKKYVMIPGHARLRHIEVEKRMALLSADVDNSPYNRIEMGDPSIGFITAGVCYTYVREAFPDASVLKLGIVNPLPVKLIVDFAKRVKRFIVVEELDSYLELRIAAMGITVEGKSLFPVTGEFNPDVIRHAFVGTGIQSKKAHIGLGSGNLTESSLPQRPPSLCPGCPHRTIFAILNKKGLTVTGDIGCYTLGVLPPFGAMDTCVEMGGSIGVAQGIEIAEQKSKVPHTVAVIGDSTFAHSGISGLINAAYNGRRSLVVVLDNGTTAMTGMQPNPMSGERITGEATQALDYRLLGLACGLSEQNIVVADAYKPKEIEAHIESLLGSGRLSLLVVKGPCVINKRKKKAKEKNG
jgi:indolepyruvate ferredoxin oxidoreductase alpha subunit